jgi:hypothetical protein
MTEKAIRNNRYYYNGAIFLLLIVSFILSRYSVEIMSLISGLPEEQIGDKGIEPLQSVMIALYKLPIGVLFSALLASFVEKQLRPDAFGTLSRWATLFLSFLLCFSLLAAK